MAMKHPQLAVLPSLRLSARPLVLAVLTLIGLAVVQATWHGYHSAREEAVRADIDAVRFAQDIASHQRAVMDQTFHLLRVLGGISVPDGQDPARCSAFLARQLERFPEYSNLAFLRADGSARCSARAGFPLLPVPGTAATTPAQPLLLSLGGGSVAAALGRGAADDEAPIAATLPLRDFLLYPAAPARDAAFAVIDGSGRVLASHPADAGWSAAGPDFIRTLLALDIGSPRRLSAAAGAEYLYLAQPIPGTVQPLRLAIRLPADAARSMAYQAVLLVAALALTAFTAWLLLRLAAERLAARLKRVDWKQLAPATAWRSRWHGIAARLGRRAAPPSARRRPGPGETTILRAAYEDLKRAFADKEERMQQVILLDELSRSSQGCHSLPELAQAIARCATELFPGSAGALLQRGANNQVETVHTWGTATPMDTISLPLIAHNESLGILNLSGVGHYDPWATTSLAERAAAGMVAVKRQEQLRHRAMRDPLTGLYNRRFLEEALDIEQRRALRRGISIGVLMLDIDHFKRFNDTYGHDAGDLLLRGMGALLRRAVREGDMPCRYGGEEFVVILPGADLAGTRRRAEALCATIARWEPQRDGAPLGPVTASIGVAALPMHGTDWQKVLKAADEALYQAKHAGRNRVACAPPPSA
jgi:diguanylate cyclase (GGDEF)-like protein